MTMKLIVSTKDGGGHRREYVLREGSFLIGRHAEADIRIGDSMVSRRHAEIYVESGVATLKDLGSRNKTFVNDKIIYGKYVLRHRDKIGIGNSHLEFIVENLFLENDIPISKIIDLNKDTLLLVNLLIMIMKSCKVLIRSW